MNVPSTTTSTFTGANNHGFQNGINTGSISTVFNVTHAAPAPQPQPQPPSSTVPFHRDRDFTTRDEFDDLWRRRDDPDFRVALVGLGGVGKSQLAIEYAYRIRDERPDVWVFWVHASSVTRVEEGFRKIAERTRPQGWDDAKANILEVVSRWLEHEQNGPWLLIVDNADETDIISEPWQGRQDRDVPSGILDTRSLLDFLPQRAHGSILVTSRSREVAFRVTGSARDVVEVRQMKTATALALLQQKLLLAPSEEEGTSLIHSLDHIPLAITHAAAYINQRHPRMSVLKYVQDLSRGDRERTKLLEQGIKDPRRDGRSSNMIISTWHISFEHIRRSWPSAARLFAFMSCFDREAIPEDLLHDYRDKNGEKNDFEDEIYILRSFCLIGLSVEKATFEMHRLVQFSVKNWLEIHNELEGWQEKYVAIMAEAFPRGNYENWKQCQMLFPHVEVVLQYRIKPVGCLKQWATVLYHASWYANERGWHDKAERMGQASFEGMRTALGEEHPDTLTSMANLASTYRDQGRWREAEALEIKVMGATKRVLGEEHPDTLTSIADLASTYRDQGRWGEAEALQIKVMETRKRVLGEEHPHTLTSISNLASTYRDQGRWGEAEALQIKVMETRKRVLGEEHPDTLTSISNLASTYRDQGRWGEAEALQIKVMGTTKRVLGEEHPHTLTSISNLASTYRNQGRWGEAEALQIKVMETRKRVLGEEHPDTLTSIANLASTYRNQGRWGEAEALQIRVMETRKRVLGEEHPHTLTSIANLASTYRDQGRWGEAEAL